MWSKVEVLSDVFWQEQYWNLQNVESELVVSVEGVSDLPAYRELELTVSFEEVSTTQN